MIGMISVILAAIALIMIGYLAVGFAGYLAFPRTVSSNVLKTFPDTAIMQVLHEWFGGLFTCLVFGELLMLLQCIFCGKHVLSAMAVMVATPICRWWIGGCAHIKDGKGRGTKIC